jgi:hypothetical protein
MVDSVDALTESPDEDAQAVDNIFSMTESWDLLADASRL